LSGTSSSSGTSTPSGTSTTAGTSPKPAPAPGRDDIAGSYLAGDLPARQFSAPNSEVGSAPTSSVSSSGGALTSSAYDEPNIIVNPGWLAPDGENSDIAGSAPTSSVSSSGGALTSSANGGYEPPRSDSFPGVIPQDDNVAN
jgi:hypothetical protein